MPIQVRGVLVHAMSGTALSRVRTEFRLRLPEPINKSPLESRGPTLLCNHLIFGRFHLPGLGVNRDLMLEYAISPGLVLLTTSL